MDQHDELVPHPAFADLARMEWALRNAFDAADATPVSAAELAAQSAYMWPSLVFDIHPSLQLLSLNWTIEPVWRAMQSFDPETGEEPELPEPEEHPHVLAIWRNGLDTRWRAADPVQATLLRAAMGGDNFGTLCSLAATQVGEEQAAIAAVVALQSWLADGLLTGIRQPA
jgi:hypothetical protein